MLSVFIAYVGINNRFSDIKVGDTTTRYENYYLEENKKGHTLSVIKLYFLMNISNGIPAIVICLLLNNLANVKMVKTYDALNYILIYSFNLLIITSNSFIYVNLVP